MDSPRYSRSRWEGCSMSQRLVSGIWYLALTVPSSGILSRWQSCDPPLSSPGTGYRDIQTCLRAWLMFKSVRSSSCWGELICLPPLTITPASAWLYVYYPGTNTQLKKMKEDLLRRAAHRSVSISKSESFISPSLPSKACWDLMRCQSRGRSCFLSSEMFVLKTI